MVRIEERDWLHCWADGYAVCVPAVRVEERDWWHRLADGDAVCAPMVRVKSMWTDSQLDKDQIAW